MPVIFSKSCEYALQAVLYISNQTNGKPKRLGEIAHALHVPQYYLSKIMQTLTRNEIVQSYKGHKGGYELGKMASEIKLNDIVRAIDGDLFLKHCVLGFPTCGDDHPCPVHSYWKDAKQVVLTMLNEKNVEDLSKNLEMKLSLLAQNSSDQHLLHKNISQDTTLPNV
jgi:Rrf2 family protein